MEKSATSERSQNPRFAILGLSHIGGKCAGGSEWSSSLSVSCFGQSNSTSADSTDHGHNTEALSSPPPTRQVSDDAVVRTLSAKANRRRLAATSDRRPSRPPPPPTTLQPSAVSGSRPHQRPSHDSLVRNSLTSDSLIIRPLRGSTAACSNSNDRPATRRISGSRSRTRPVVEPSSRREVAVSSPTTVGDSDQQQKTCTDGRHHLDVFLPSLVVRQSIEADQ